MPRVDVPVTEIVRAGVAPPAETNADVANGHHISNDGRVVLLARNSDAGGAHNVTIQTPGTIDGLAVADRVVSLPLSSSKYIGPFPTGVYNQQGVAADADRIYVDVDHATLRLTALRLPL